MSLFSIVKNVMDSNGWPTPVTSVASSQDQNMRQAFSLCNDSVKNVSFRKDWPQLVSFVQIDFIPGQSDYDAPTDFHHLVSPSAFDITEYVRLVGNLTPMQLTRYLSSGNSAALSGFYLNYKLRKIQITPTPQSAKSVMYAYVTANIVRDASGNGKTAYSQDDDVAVVDEDIVELGAVWRWRQKKGLDYSSEIAEFSATLSQRFAQYMAMGEIPIGCMPPGDAPLTSGYIGAGPIGV